MQIKKHIQITEIFFDYGYEEVHKWIDELFFKYYGFEHWKHRHHQEAIIKKYGLDSIEYRVACLHILCDWFDHLGVFILPNNEREVIKELDDRGLLFKGKI